MKLLHAINRVARVCRMLEWDQFIKVAVQYGLGTRLNQLTVPGLQHPLWWRGGKTDAKVISQIFAGKECDMDLTHSPDLIVDGGANAGYSAVFFAHKYPGVPIIAVEPDEENLKILRLNCEPYPQIQSVAGAIWKSRAHLRIANPEAQSWAFTVEELSRPAPGSFQASTVDDLIGDASNVLLKLDIEGAETVVFGHDMPWLDAVGSLVIEVHGQEAERVVRTAMARVNYSVARKGEKLMFVRPDAPRARAVKLERAVSPPVTSSTAR